MDMKKNSKIPKCGVLPEIAGKKVIVGAKQLRKAIAKGCVRYVFLAENADPAVTEPLEAMCGEKDILIHWVPDMAGLGQVCGIEVGAAAAAVIDP